MENMLMIGILSILFFLILDVHLLFWGHKKIKDNKKIIMFYVIYAILNVVIIFFAITPDSFPLPPNKDIDYAIIKNNSKDISLKISKEEAQNLLSKLERRVYTDARILKFISLLTNRYQPVTNYNLSIEFYNFNKNKVLGIDSSFFITSGFYVIGINGENYNVREDFYNYLFKLLEDHGFDKNTKEFDESIKELNSHK